MVDGGGLENRCPKGSRVRILLPPPKHNSVRSEEMQKAVRNSGFFVVFSPKTCYKILQNTPIMGIR